VIGKEENAKKRTVVQQLERWKSAGKEKEDSERGMISLNDRSARNGKKQWRNGKGDERQAATTN
jgi:hypothetical protein